MGYRALLRHLDLTPHGLPGCGLSREYGAVCHITPIRFGQDYARKVPEFLGRQIYFLTQDHYTAFSEGIPESLSRCRKRPAITTGISYGVYTTTSSLDCFELRFLRLCLIAELKCRCPAFLITWTSPPT